MTETLLAAYTALDNAWVAAEKKCKEIGYAFFAAVPISGLETLDDVDKSLMLAWNRMPNGHMRLCIGSEQLGFNNLACGARTDIRMLAVESFPDLLKVLHGESVQLEKDLFNAAEKLWGFIP